MEKHQCESHIGCLPHVPLLGQGLSLQPRYVPLIKTEPRTLRFEGQHSIH